MEQAILGGRIIMEMWKNFDGRLFDTLLNPSLGDCSEIVEELTEEELTEFKEMVRKYSFSNLDPNENLVINLIILGEDKTTVFNALLGNPEEAEKEKFENYAMMKIVHVRGIIRSIKKARSLFDLENVKLAIPEN